MHAQAIVEAHEITLADSEESQMLLEQNPDLYEAYEWLLTVAAGR
jgi:hypothetical protein